jgi:imidazolonepropionase-like amidohydrolase
MRNIVYPLNHILLLTLFFSLIMVSCGEQPDEDLTVYTNAVIWTGTNEEPLENAALLVSEGKVVQVMSMDDANFPRRAKSVDLEGRYIIPGLINAHGHVGVADGLVGGVDAHNTDNVIRQLRLYARYGITTVVSLGDEPIHAFLVRDNIDQAENGMARMFLAGDVLNPSSAEEAAEDVARRMERNPDWTKIRVDDGLGTREKMSPEVYSAVIEASHSHGVPLAAHIVTLEDAKGVLQSGADLIAHSVRNAPVDDEFIDMMLERNVCLTPTLTREVSTYIYAERPPFFDDPFFTKGVAPAIIEHLQLPNVQEMFTGRSADYFRDALPLAERNMVDLHEAGVRIAMGTDSGPPARFQGYFEHMEMEMMEAAGMSTLDVLTSATRYAAECTFIDDELGSLEPGKHADFVVLDQNPLESIRNLRSIHAVYIGGNAVNLSPQGRN